MELFQGGWMAGSGGCIVKCIIFTGGRSSLMDGTRTHRNDRC